MSPAKRKTGLSRRERQIMDVAYRLGSPTGAEIAAALPDPPSYSAVRALLSILVGKGHLRTKSEGNRYRYTPTVPRGVARERALRDVVANFFSGSSKAAVVALLDDSSLEMSREEMDEIRRMIERAKKRTR